MKNVDKPYTFDDLVASVKDLEFHKDGHKNYQDQRKVCQSRLDEATMNENRSYNKMKELEAKIRNIIGNLEK